MKIWRDNFDFFLRDILEIQYKSEIVIMEKYVFVVFELSCFV